MRDAHEQLINTMDQVAAGLSTESSDNILARLETLIQDQADVDQASEQAEVINQEFAEDLEAIDLGLDLEEIEPATPETDASHEATEATAPSDAEESDDELDQELAEIFLEEARDLIDSTADALQNWSENTHNLDLLRLLQRDLHTLKGGARLADIPSIGDLSHELETLFEGLTEQRLSINDDLSDLLFRAHDRLAGMVEALEASETPRPAPDLIGEIQAYMDNADGSRPVTDVSTASDTPAEDESLPLPDLQEQEEPAPSEDLASEDNVTDLSHLDPELVGIFLEEAYDLINSTGSALHSWSEDPSTGPLPQSCSAMCTP